MNSSANSVKKTGLTILLGFLLVATVALWQKALIVIKSAIDDSAKLRPTADSCNESKDSGSPHFTGCSSIL